MLPLWCCHPLRMCDVLCGKFSETFQTTLFNVCKCLVVICSLVLLVVSVVERKILKKSTVRNLFRLFTNMTLHMIFPHGNSGLGCFALISPQNSWAPCWFSSNPLIEVLQRSNHACTLRCIAILYPITYMKSKWFTLYNFDFMIDIFDKVQQTEVVLLTTSAFETVAAFAMSATVSLSPTNHVLPFKSVSNISKASATLLFRSSGTDEAVP